MEIKTLEQSTLEVKAHYLYGCENKKYHITFYINILEKEEKVGITKTILGVVENFDPNRQTAIRDANGDLWLIESKLISVMKPMNKFELKKFEERSNQ